MGKSSKTKVGYHYRPAYHVGLCRGPIDAFLEFRAADKAAWRGELTASGRIAINAPQLFGGESDQGGIVGPVDVMFGEADQQPNSYLQSVFGGQTVAWRGLATLAFCGGRFGAMNPMPQKPAYKVRKIVQGWDVGECWFPETAEVPVDLGAVLALGPTSTGWSYLIAPGDDGMAQPDYDDSAWLVGASPFASEPNHPYTAPGGYPNVVGTLWPTDTTIWVRRRFHLEDPTGFKLEIFVDNFATVWINGHLVLPRVGNSQVPSDEAFRHPIDVPASVLRTGENVIALKAEDFGFQTYAAFRVTSGGGLYAMNPAHALYYVRTDSEKGREPRQNINQESMRLAAQRLFDEGFGVCWEYDPARDTPDGFEERICRIIGGAFTRSRTDGQWYLDLARGDYDLDALPIIGDDDILQFKELPTTLDRAVNSISVRYFDPTRKETVITPAIRALGLIRQFGEIHETLEMPEIPNARMALIVAERELRARVTPTRTFEIVTTPRPRGLRINQYFRLQSPKRRITDLVCIVGERAAGTLRSGAITWKVSQDVYMQSAGTYADIEHGVDTRPPQVPLPILASRVFEAPYIDLVATLPRAEFEALPEDAGFLVAVADDPGQHIDFTMATQPDGGQYRLAGKGDWCATGLSTAAHAAQSTPVSVPLSNARLLDRVAVGAVAVWDGEWCRVDAIDADAVPPVCVLARGCADTVPVAHAAGSRVWFVANEVAADLTEYTDGETVNVRLLSNTGSQQYPLELALATEVTLDRRQARPYPPAGLSVEMDDSSATVQLAWAHRDRVAQGDQLIDQTIASIGPEPGTTYTLRWYINGAPAGEQSSIAATSASFPAPAAGLLRLELFSVRGGLASWQMHVRELQLGDPLQHEDGAPLTFDDDQPILLE